MSRSAHLEQMHGEAAHFRRNFLHHLRSYLINADHDPEIHSVVGITTDAD